MLLIQSNWQDIQKYYLDSYVKLQEFGDQIFFICAVNKEGVKFTDDKGEEGIIWLHDECPYTLNMVLPNKSFFQKDNFCYSLARVPARQYHRGITSENCSLTYLQGSTWRKASIGFENLTHYVNKPWFRPLDTAIMTPRLYSEALSPRFAYSSTDCTIWCDSHPIGTVNKETDTITCQSLFLTEVSRLLSSSQSKFKLVAAK